MICWLQDFFTNWAVAVEAVATLLLVIAAAFQWWTMRAQAQQERDRWNGDDKIRAEASKPRAEFWFEIIGGVYVLNCANLGSVGFFVWRLGIQPVVSNETNWHSEQTPGHSIIKEFVPVGLKHTKKIYDLGFHLQDLGDNYEFTLFLSNPQGDESEIRRPFHKWKSSDQGIMIGEGFVGCVVSKCPKCNTSCDSILVGDLKSSEEIRQRLDEIHDEYRQTCPEHKTTCKRVYRDADPPTGMPVE